MMTQQHHVAISRSDDLSLKAVDVTKAQRVYYQGWHLPFIICTLIMILLHLIIANVQPVRVSYYSPRNTRREYCTTIKNQFTAVCIGGRGDKNCQIVQNVTMTETPTTQEVAAPAAPAVVLPLIMCQKKPNKQSALDCHSEQMRLFDEKWHNFACGKVQVRNLGIFVSSANRNFNHALRWSDITDNYQVEKLCVALISLFYALLGMVLIGFIVFGTVPTYLKSVVIPPSHNMAAQHDNDMGSESTSIIISTNNPSRSLKSHLKSALAYNSIIMPNTMENSSFNKKYSLNNGPVNGGTFDPHAPTWKLMAISSAFTLEEETCVWTTCAERRLMIWLPFIVREVIKLCGVILLGLLFILLAKVSYIIRIYLVAQVTLPYTLLALLVIFHVANNIAQKMTTEYMLTDRRIIITRFNVFHFKREILFLNLKHVVQVNYNPETNMIGVEAETGEKDVPRIKNLIQRRFVLEGIAGTERVAKLIKGEAERARED